MLRRPHIVIWDSGVGGLILSEPLARAWPFGKISYVCDSAFFPYGSKSEEDLYQRAKDLSELYFKALRPDLLVVACGSAATLTLPFLRALDLCPVVGMVPPIKPAAEQTRSGHIALLATPGTVKRSYMDQLISMHCGGVELRRLGSQLMVQMAEDKLRGIACDTEALRVELQSLFEAPGQVDTVALGCTHFPLLMAELRAISPWPVTWLSPAEGAVRRCLSLLGERFPEFDTSSPGESVPELRWHFSAQHDNHSALMPYLSSQGFKVSYDFP